MMGLYGAIRAEARRVPRVRQRLPRCAAFPSRKSPTPTPSASPTFRRIAAGRPASAALDRLQSAPAFVRQPQRRASPRRPGELALTERLARGSIFAAIDGGRPRRCPAATSRRSRCRNGWRSSPPFCSLNDPTRGVDVETKREIYLALRAMAAEGKAVVLLSSDTPELVHLCDRVMVFNKGRVAATLQHAEASEEAIVAAAMGVRKAPTLQGEAV